MPCPAFHRAGLLRSMLRTLLQRRPPLAVTLRCLAGKRPARLPAVLPPLTDGAAGYRQSSEPAGQRARWTLRKESHAVAGIGANGQPEFSYGWHLKGGSRDTVGEVQMLVRWRLVSWSCRLMLTRSCSAPTREWLMSLTWGVIRAVPRLSALWMVSRVPSMEWVMPWTLSSTEEVSMSEEEIEDAEPVTPVRVVDTVARALEVEVSEVEVSVSEVSIPRAVPRMETREAVASATCPRMGLRAVSMSVREELMVWM